MPYGEMPWVREGRLLIRDHAPIVVDSSAWFDWLATVTSFCYSDHASVRLTVRYEKRGSQFYWYAYSRIDSKLHNVYLGRSSKLTQQRLDDACQQIYQRAKERRKPANVEHRFIVSDHR